jgi:hypothetical protein
MAGLFIGLLASTSFQLAEQGGQQAPYGAANPGRPSGGLIGLPSECLATHRRRHGFLNRVAKKSGHYATYKLALALLAAAQLKCAQDLPQELPRRYNYLFEYSIDEVTNGAGRTPQRLCPA